MNYYQWGLGLVRFQKLFELPGEGWENENHKVTKTNNH